MTGIVVLLFIAGGIWILGKVCGGVERFFRPTTTYIKKCILDALISLGMPRDLAIAVWPFIKLALFALAIAIIVWCH